MVGTSATRTPCRRQRWANRCIAAAEVTTLTAVKVRHRPPTSNSFVRRGRRPTSPELPRRAHCPQGEPAVGLVVADELLPFRIPPELAVEPGGDVAEVAERVGLDGFVNGANRRPAALHAIEEIADVIRAAHQAGSRRADGFLGEVLRRSPQSAA